MNKTLIIPVVALFVLFLKHSFGIVIPQEQVDIIADGVLSIITLIGVFMHPVKPEAESDDAK